MRASATDTVEWRDIHYVVPEPVIEVPDIELPTIEVPTPIVIVRPIVEGSEPSEKDPRLGDNILKNGDFAKGKEGWRVYNEGQPGEATWSVKNGVATLTFPAVSDNMQLYQSDLVTTEGEYQLTFDAKGKDGHTLEVFYHQHERPYLSLGLATGVTLAEKWKTYVIPFTVPETETNGRLRFWFVGHANKGDQFELRSVRAPADSTRLGRLGLRLKMQHRTIIKTSRRNGGTFLFLIGCSFRVIERVGASS